MNRRQADKLRVIPVSLATAQEFIRAHHRHLAPPHFHRFSLGAVNGATGDLAGVLVAAKPTARATPQDRVLEVSRLATDGTFNTCSMLYSAAARAAKAMGYERIQTFTLEEEHGNSLRASGWTLTDPKCGGDQWTNRRGRTPTPPGTRKRYERQLNNQWPETTPSPANSWSPVQTALPI